MRSRSNNGWGVDALEPEDLADLDLAGDDRASHLENGSPAQDEKDPFEVGWDDGDNDPLNPRSMPLWRKWSIIIITSFGSFCV